LARSGKSITASDVIKAITELDFGPSDNLVPLLEHELAGKCCSTTFRAALDSLAYRTHVQAVKAAKGKPAGPGRGKGRRSTNVNQEEDVDMDGGGAADGDEDGDEDEDGGDEDGPEGNEAGEEDEETG
jgi:DNA polymerase epsilon subunit 3